jgi:hypothetical protein
MKSGLFSCKRAGRLAKSGSLKQLRERTDRREGTALLSSLLLNGAAIEETSVHDELGRRSGSLLDEAGRALLEEDR